MFAMVRERNRRLLVELGRHGAGTLLVVAWCYMFAFVLGIDTSSEPDAERLFPFRSALVIVGLGAILTLTTSARMMRVKWLFPGWSCGVLIPLASAGLFLLQLVISDAGPTPGLLPSEIVNFISFRPLNPLVFSILGCAALVPTLLRYAPLRAWMRLLIGAVVCLFPAIAYSTFMFVQLS